MEFAEYERVFSFKLNLLKFMTASKETSHLAGSDEYNKERPLRLTVHSPISSPISFPSCKAREGNRGGGTKDQENKL